MFRDAGKASTPCDSLVSSMGMLSRHSYSACRLLRCATLQRPHSGSWDAMRGPRAFRSEGVADDWEYERETTKVKRKVAMHVAYCGTGYQGKDYIFCASRHSGNVHSPYIRL